MRPTDEVASILERLGFRETVRKSRTRIAKIDSDGRKLYSICGVSFPIEEFEYGGRYSNSYCTACCKLHSQAYARGGSEATRRFREEMRKKWKS